MSKPRILIVYASQLGSTAELAEALAASFRRGGASVDVFPVLDVSDLEAYAAVVVASPIYNGAWLPEAQYFVRHYAARLAQRAVAYVVVSATMRQDTPVGRAGARSFLEPLLRDVPAVKPVAIGLFAGRVDYRRMPWWLRLRVYLAGLRQGDSRDWDAVAQWAAHTLPLLTNG